MRWWERKEEIRGCSLGCRAIESRSSFSDSIALGLGIGQGSWEQDGCMNYL